MIVLNQEEVKQCISMQEAISICKDAFIDLSDGKVKVPLRTAINNEDVHSHALFMPSFSAKKMKYAIKMVSINELNPARNLPFIHAVILMINAETGQMEAMMDGEWITGLRTGAAAGVASNLLSRNDSKTFALFGTGKQADFQIESILSVRPIRNILIFSGKFENAKKYAESVRKKFKVEAEACNDQALLERADIITTATTSMDPVFQEKYISTGTHINGIGSYLPDMQEIPEAIIEKARIYTDQKEACLKEAGDLIIPLENGRIHEQHIVGEIGQLANGQIQGRIQSEDITFFKSVGNAVQDLYVSSYILQNAINKNLGQSIDL